MTTSNEPQERLANLLLIGASRTGSTSLFHYLSQHPQICPSSIKEPDFFGNGSFKPDGLPSIQEYSDQFRACGNQRYRLEASVVYLYHADQITSRVNELLGDVRLLVCLREPIERTLSHYRFHSSRLTYETDLSLERYLKRSRQLSQEELRSRAGVGFWGLEGGKYIKYLRPWHAEFGDRLKILFFDDLRDDTRAFVNSIYSWLDLRPEEAPDFAIHRFNQSANFRLARLQRGAVAFNDSSEAFWRRYPHLKIFLRSVYYLVNRKPFVEEIAPDVRQELQAFFEPYNRQLVAFLKDIGYTSLPPWLEDVETVPFAD